MKINFRQLTGHTYELEIVMDDGIISEEFTPDESAIKLYSFPDGSIHKELLESYALIKLLQQMSTAVYFHKKPIQTKFYHEITHIKKINNMSDNAE